MIIAQSITEPIKCLERKQLSTYKPISNDEGVESDRSEPLGLCCWKWAKPFSTDAQSTMGQWSLTPRNSILPFIWTIASTIYSFSYGCVTGSDIHNNQSPRNWERDRASKPSISNLVKPQEILMYTAQGSFHSQVKCLGLLEVRWRSTAACRIKRACSVCVNLEQL